MFYGGGVVTRRRALPEKRGSLRGCCWTGFVGRRVSAARVAVHGLLETLDRGSGNDRKNIIHLDGRDTGKS
jgi:hypothetical protein